MTLPLTCINGFSCLNAMEGGTLWGYLCTNKGYLIYLVKLKIKEYETS